jgi:hypothetical protein
MPERKGFDIVLSTSVVPLKPGQIGIVHQHRTLVRDGLFEQFGAVTFAMFRFLLLRSPDVLTSDEVMAFAFGDDEYGGPVRYSFSYYVKREIYAERLGRLGLCIPKLSGMGRVYQMVDLRREKNDGNRPCHC